MTDLQYLQNEISRDLPHGYTPRTFKGGKPILYAFECALLERETGNGFSYSTENLTNGTCETLIWRRSPLLPHEIEKMALRMRRATVAGAGCHEIDRPVGQRIPFTKAHEMLIYIFKKVLPQYGYLIRKEQISLAEHILNSIYKGRTTLAEAEVGTGKTLAYLVAATVAKRGRLNDLSNMSLYPGMQYAKCPPMPIVIATSSIALQRAILKEYIPELSRILLENGIIKTPLTAVIRKGKEHYICERSLRSYLTYETDINVRRTLERLLLPKAKIDLAEIDGSNTLGKLTAYVKRKISVSGRCSECCHYYKTCRYLAFREWAQSPEIDIQVCNHNYLLADVLHRANKQSPLIPDYQSLIIDEAHKYLAAARSMYGTQLSSQSSPYILETIDRLRFKREGFQSLACKSAKKLCNESMKLFHVLIENACDNNDSEDESERFAANIDTEATRHLRNICAITERLIILMRDEAFYGKSEELLAWVSERYGANTTPISLQSILGDTATNDGMRASQEELMSVQIISIHKAICQLPEIRHCIEIERNNRKQQFYRNKPERQAIRGERSAVSDAIWNKMQKMLPVERAFGKSSEWIIRLIWDLQQVHDQSAIFAKHGSLIYWLEMDDSETRLCAIPKNLDKRLFSDQWKNYVPTVLTSGTLSAGGDFTHTKRTLGLDMLGGKLAETSKQSPFNYKENVLLYISENVPFPNQRDMQYIDAVADETERLINAAHGHTAVLFTSYKVMDMVWERLTNRGLDFPMFRLNKGGAGAIEQFKQSGNGVLFASGALWEGIDIPGDALSLLIIVKLPFAVPDPISEYEQTLYKDMDEYKRFVIVPEMLIKLMQGFGRLIRTETDTGVVAILDCRAGLYGAYRIDVINALHGCNMTAQICDVTDFFKIKKTQSYFAA